MMSDIRLVDVLPRGTDSQLRISRHGDEIVLAQYTQDEQGHWIEQSAISIGVAEAEIVGQDLSEEHYRGHARH